MDVRRPKRRPYTCLQCERGQKIHVFERYRMTAHVYRSHRPLDQVPFFCTLCQYRCMPMAVLEKHAAQPKHLSDARKRGGEHRRFLGQNFNPKVPVEGVDFRLATEEETNQRLCVDESQLDEDESEGAEQETGLINIQFTPQMLAQLTSGRTGQQECGPVVRSLAPVPAYDPAMPGYTSAGQSFPVYTAVTTATYGSAIGVSAPSTAYIPLDIGTSSVGQTSAPSTSASPIVSAPTSVYTAPVSSCPVSTPVYVPSFGDTLITSGLDSMLNSQARVSSGVPTSEPLDTPQVRRTPLNYMGTPEQEVKDIKDQLLGQGEDQSFSPAVSMTVDMGTQTKVTHYKTDLTPTALSMAVTRLDKILKGALERIAQAIDRNSRRIEDVTKTMAVAADSLRRMERSLDNIALKRGAQDRKSDVAESSEKRPRLDGKENQRPKLSSVVKDPSRTKRSGK